MAWVRVEFSLRTAINLVDDIGAGGRRFLHVGWMVRERLETLASAD